MLLGRPWLKDAKIIHDWGNNAINVQGNGIVTIILINRKLGAKTERPQVVMNRLQTSGELQDKTSFIDPSIGGDLLKSCSPDYLLL
jgi:hypothetical protein